MKNKQKMKTAQSDSEESLELSEGESFNESDEGYDDALEDLEETELGIKDENQLLKKRRHDEENGPSITKSKKQKHEVRPPTAEEMIRLKETENLYQSNLFRLQIEEMMSELKPRKSDKKGIKHWVQNFKQFLADLDEEVIAINDKRNVVDDILLPLPTRSWQIDESIKFLKPLDIKLMGSFPNGTIIGPHFVLDVAIIIPKKFYQKEDYINQKYHYKRAFYLSIIASRIQESQFVDSNSDMKFWCKRGDSLKPILLFRPPGRMNQFVEIALNILPEENPFKLNRFLPEKNNVRPEWLGKRRKHGILPPTPYYNVSILEDIVANMNEQVKLEIFEGNQNLKDAIILLSVWLRQRKLSEGYGAFNMHLLTMYLVYLVKKQKINNHMSSYQICRNVWLNLAQSDWTKQGITLCTNEKPPYSLEKFHNFFEIVFIDCSGLLNLCSRLNKTIYLRIKEEADKAIKFLNDPNVNTFQILFMMNMHFLQQYDHFISFTDPSVANNVLIENSDIDIIMDYNCDKIPSFIKVVTDLLIKGLGNRVRYLCMQSISTSTWKINEEAPDTILNDVLIFGLKLNPETALSVIEKGPEANKDEAEKFREFWGNKCELRRFRDGTVCESVCWQDNNTNLTNRRMIVKKIVDYLLTNKLQMSTVSYTYIANQLDHLIINKLEPESTNEEAAQSVHKVFENVSQQLRDLTDLPLNIVSVRCISPVYRFTEVFPPLPEKHFVNKRISKLTKYGVVFKQNETINITPFYVEPIDLVLQMAMTQKWPNDIKAGKRLIAAFNIVIASSLKKKYGLDCQITTDYTTVQKDGYIFRLHLGYSKEISLLKQQISAEGITFYRDTPESIALEKKFINLPKVTGAIYGISQIYSGFGNATCLVKRWISSHLFDDFHFPTLVIEQLMAKLFLSPQPYETAIQPLTAFLRFLSYIATTNWHIEPVVVNFNNLLTKEQMVDIEKTFQANRSSLPPLVLATPYDLAGTLWTKDAPTLPTLIKLSKLAATSIKMLDVLLTTSPTQQNLMKVFEPPLSSFDAVITMKKDVLPRRLQCLDLKGIVKNTDITQLPITGFDPAIIYLQELREKYNDYALFFHDTYGGTIIGVVFRPSFLKTADFKTSHVGPRKPELSDGKVDLVPSKEALINGFYVLGTGLVHKIELR